MVKAFHAAGIEVILDVVYNHTAEGEAARADATRFRGLDDRGYYQRVATPAVGDAYLGRHRLRQHRRLDQPRRAAADPGLAALLGHRDARRRLPLRPGLGPGPHRPARSTCSSAFLTAIGQDPVLRHVKLIAEPWDASMDGYRVGLVPAAVGRVERPVPRHDARLLARPPGDVRHARLRGSPARRDLYADDGRSPYASVNFVTAHDGFTLRDLVSYDAKHNEANGEDNRDGTDNNRSWNHGVEGETDDPDDHRAAAAAGRQPDGHAVPRRPASPMITAGDERGRTQRGNNNAYVPGQRDLVGRLAARRRVARRLRPHQDRAAAAPRPPGAAAAALLRGDADDRRRSEGPRLDAPVGPRDGGRRTGTTTRCTSSACSSPATRSAPPARAASSSATRSFLIWLNAGDDAVEVTLPENDWVQDGEVVLSTDRPPRRDRRRSGDVLSSAPHRGGPARG